MRRPPLDRRSARRLCPSQRGAAVLMALFVATLATLIVTGLFWNQFIVLRTIENQQLTVQGRMLLAGALDWARAILREDRNNYDALTEPWAQPLAETRLDQLGETLSLASRATIEGSIEDAQSRMNLRNLVSPDPNIARGELEALRRLCGLLSLPSATADLISVSMVDSGIGLTGVPTAGTEGSIAVRPLPLVLPQDLYGVRGMDPQAAAKLVPYVTVLDVPTPINVNTAAAEVIAARIGITLSAARALVAERDRIGYFKDVPDFSTRPQLRGITLDASQLSAQSRYFLIRGKVKLDRAVTRMEALVRRPGVNQVVQVLWQREL